jgi:hypothetical protein
MVNDQRQPPAVGKATRQEVQQRRGIAAARETDTERPGAKNRFIKPDQGLALAAGASNPAMRV